MRIIPSFCEKASLYNAANKAGGAKASQSGGVGAKFCVQSEQNGYKREKCLFPKYIFK